MAEEKAPKEYASIKAMINRYRNRSILLFCIEPRTDTDVKIFQTGLSDGLSNLNEAMGYDFGAYMLPNRHKQVEFWLTIGPKVEKAIKNDDEIFNMVTGVLIARLGVHVIESKVKNPVDEKFE